MKSIFFCLLIVVSLTSHAQHGGNDIFKLRENDDVLSGNSIRRIKYIDHSGRVTLEETSSYYESYTRAKKISKIVAHYGEFCKGDTVLNNNSIRTIKFVDNSGRIVLEDPSPYYRTYTTAKKISKILECHGNFCKEDKVLDKVISGDSIRVIEFVDNSGRIVLEKTSNYPRDYTTANSLSMIEKSDRHNKEQQTLYGCDSLKRASLDQLD